MISNKINTRVSLGWLLFMTSFIGLFFCTFFSSTTFVVYGNINILWQMMRVYAVFAIGFKCICIDKYSVKKLVLCATAAILALIVFYYCGRGFILDAIILIIGANGISYKKILKLYFNLAVIFMTVTFVASLTGIIIDYTTIRTVGGVEIGSRLRHSFGINYPTDFAAHVFFIYLTYRVLTAEKRKMNILDFVLTVLIIVGLDYYCDARLSEIFIGLTYLLFFLFEKRNSLLNNKLVRKIILFSFPVAACIAISMTCCYNSADKTWVMIDENFFSNRLVVAHKVFEQNGVKLFGQFIEMQGLGFKVHGFDTSIGTTYLDSSYMQLLLLYGIVMTVFIIGVLTVFSKKVIEDNNIELCIVVLVLAYSCIINQYLLNIAYNPFILVVGATVFGLNTVRQKDMHKIPVSGDRING